MRLFHIIEDLIMDRPLVSWPTNTLFLSLIVYKVKTIWNSFAAVGLVPFDLD